MRCSAAGLVSLLTPPTQTAQLSPPPATRVRIRSFSHLPLSRPAAPSETQARTGRCPCPSKVRSTEMTSAHCKAHDRMWKCEGRRGPDRWKATVKCAGRNWIDDERTGGQSRGQDRKPNQPRFISYLFLPRHRLSSSFSSSTHRRRSFTSTTLSLHPAAQETITLAVRPQLAHDVDSTCRVGLDPECPVRAANGNLGVGCDNDKAESGPPSCVRGSVWPDERCLPAAIGSAENSPAAGIRCRRPEEVISICRLQVLFPFPR